MVRLTLSAVVASWTSSKGQYAASFFGIPKCEGSAGGTGPGSDPPGWPGLSGRIDLSSSTAVAGTPPANAKSEDVWMNSRRFISFLDSRSVLPMHKPAHARRPQVYTFHPLFRA